MLRSFLSMFQLSFSWIYRMEFFLWASSLFQWLKKKICLLIIFSLWLSLIFPFAFLCQNRFIKLEYIQNNVTYSGIKNINIDTHLLLFCLRKKNKQTETTQIFEDSECPFQIPISLLYPQRSTFTKFLLFNTFWNFYHMWLYLWTECYLVLHRICILYFPSCFLLWPFCPWHASILISEGVTFCRSIYMVTLQVIDLFSSWYFYLK